MLDDCALDDHRLRYLAGNRLAGQQRLLDLVALDGGPAHRLVALDDLEPPLGRRVLPVDHHVVALG